MTHYCACPMPACALPARALLAGNQKSEHHHAYSREPASTTLPVLRAGVARAWPVSGISRPPSASEPGDGGSAACSELPSRPPCHSSPVLTPAAPPFSPSAFSVARSSASGAALPAVQPRRALVSVPALPAAPGAHDVVLGASGGSGVDTGASAGGDDGARDDYSVPGSSRLFSPLQSWRLGGGGTHARGAENSPPAADVAVVQLSKDVLAAVASAATLWPPRHKGSSKSEHRDGRGSRTTVRGFLRLPPPKRLRSFHGCPACPCSQTRVDPVRGSRKARHAMAKVSGL